MTFIPFPTPILNRDGALVGAINLLLDITDLRQIAELQEQARRCRRLIAEVSDALTVNALGTLAAECDAKATELEAGLPFFSLPEIARA